MTLINNSTKAIALIFTGAAVTALVFIIATPAVDNNNSQQSAPEILYWVAPMDENYRRDKPGLSPMGMELIPVYNNAQQEDASVTISPSVEQSLGVRTAAVSQGDFRYSILATGISSWDQASIIKLHPRADGWLETLTVTRAGDSIRQGQTVYELFSPRLVSAQREYLTAIQSNNQPLSQAARDRLRALGFTAQQIKQLKKRGNVTERLAYTAQHDAVVVKLNARPGSYVKPDSAILTLASLKRIWLDVEVPETQSHWLQTGLTATATFIALPGQQFSGHIAHIEPMLEPTTRSLRLRLAFNNAHQRIKPHMFAQVSIAAAPQKNTLSVPREAVIRSGKGSRVLMALGQGKFSVRPVRIGAVSHGYIEILSGLEASEQVVTSGQFLLDSEANGEQAMARLQQP